jgi:hypothetical protein
VAVLLFAALAWGSSANMPDLRFSFRRQLSTFCLQGLSNERRSSSHKPPKEQIQKERLLLPPFHPQAACKVVPAFFRSIPLKFGVATPYKKAHCWLVGAVHEDDGSRVTVCGHSYGSGRLGTTSLLPGVQVSRLHKSTIGLACRLFPSPVQVVPIVVPYSSAMLVLCRCDQQPIVDRRSTSLSCTYRHSPA